MSGLEDNRKQEASRWLKIAVDDRIVARACLDMVPSKPGIAAYHCQQAAEKILKGMLVVAGVHFRKTHDLRPLADLVDAPYPAPRACATRRSG